MKFFTIIAVVCYLFIATNCLPETEIIKECSEKYGVPSVDANQLVNHIKVAFYQRDKCMIRCFLEAGEYYVNDKVDFGKMLESQKKFLSPEQQKIVEKIYKICEDYIIHFTDECEVAYEAYHCTKPKPSYLYPN